MTGSKWFISRLVQNTTILDWEFLRPTFFPASSFSFPNLTVLKVSTGAYNSSLPLCDTFWLPLKPIPRLTTLDLRFQPSYRFFSAIPSHPEVDLSYSFPNMTYLSIKARGTGELPHDWPKKLPQGLRTLKVVFTSPSSPVPYCKTLSSLPQGLVHLELDHACPIDEGDLELAKFEKLHTLRLQIANWRVLQQPFPKELEVVHITVLRDDLSIARGPANVHFKISNLPPKIRVWSVASASFFFNYDAKAPSTLEELHPGRLLTALHMSVVNRAFHCEKLKVLHFEDQESLLYYLPILTNLEDMGPFSIDLDTFWGVLPQTLKAVSLTASVRATAKPLDWLPRSLTRVNTYIVTPEDVAALPRSVTDLSLRLLESHDEELNYGGQNYTTKPFIRSISIPAPAWKHFPPRLTRLKLNSALIPQMSCLSSLPRTLVELELFFSMQHYDMWKKIKFPAHLRRSLKKLDIVGQYRRGAKAEWINPEMSRFLRLSTLQIDARIIVDHETFYNLPQTLTSLTIHCSEFEGFGLPKRTTKRKLDWADGALSNLPEALISLSLYIHGATKPDPIDPMLMSRLPEKLSHFSFESVIDVLGSPKELIDLLPKRLQYIHCSANFREAQRTLQSALSAYRSSNIFSALESE